MSHFCKKLRIFSLVFAMLLLPSLARGEPMDTVKLELYYMPSCPYCKRVTEYINKQHLDIPLIDISKVPGARQTLVRKGGKSQVPCLFINDKPLYESLDIIKWLDANKQYIQHTQYQ